MNPSMQRALALFRALDCDGDFRLGPGDLEAVERRYYPPSPGAPDAPAPFAALSSVPDGTLDFVEFLDFVQEASLLSALSNGILVTRLVRRMANGEASMDFPTLARKMRAAGYGVGDEELATVFRLFLGAKTDSVSADDLLSLFIKTQG